MTKNIYYNEPELLAWMRENKAQVEADQLAHEQIITVYVFGEARATCKGGRCIEISGIPTPTGLDNYEFEPQVGWSAGQLRRAGFIIIS